MKVLFQTAVVAAAILSATAQLEYDFDYPSLVERQEDIEFITEEFDDCISVPSTSAAQSCTGTLCSGGGVVTSTAIETSTNVITSCTRCSGSGTSSVSGSMTMPMPCPDCLGGGSMGMSSMSGGSMTMPTACSNCPGGGSMSGGMSMSGSFSGDITITNTRTKTYCPTCTHDTMMSSSGGGFTTTYETVYQSICPTGLVDQTYTITETCSEESACSKPPATVMPSGFGTTVTVCTQCAAGPTTVTLTVCTACPESMMGPAGSGMAPSGGAAGGAGLSGSGSGAGPAPSGSATAPAPSGSAGLAAPAGSGTAAAASGTDMPAGSGAAAGPAGTSTTTVGVESAKADAGASSSSPSDAAGAGAGAGSEPPAESSKAADAKTDEGPGDSSSSPSATDAVKGDVNATSSESDSSPVFTGDAAITPINIIWAGSLATVLGVALFVL